MANGLPKRWAFKFGAYYYRPHPSEKDLFDGKSWYRLGDTYPKALRKFASIKEIEAGEVLASAVDRYTVEVLPTLKPQTQASYSAALKRIRQGLGHNKVVMIKPQLVYQYMDNVSRARSMNLANTDLKVLNQVLRHCVRWGVIEQNQITGAVKYFGKRDGLKKERDRYVQDWELAAWLSVAKPQQVAFAALVLLIGTRKADTLRIMEAHIAGDALYVKDSKTRKDDPFEMTEALKEAIKIWNFFQKCLAIAISFFANGRSFALWSKFCTWKKSTCLLSIIQNKICSFVHVGHVAVIGIKNKLE